MTVLVPTSGLFIWAGWALAVLLWPLAVSYLASRLRPSWRSAVRRFTPHFVLLAICGGGPLLIRPGVSFVRLAVQFALLAALWALAVLVSQSMGNRASQLVDGA